MDNITEFEKRKTDMMELWKETFHDSDRYISLVFDTYFSLENTFVRYHQNRLIAAMLCVGYEFQILNEDGKKRRLRGMYLCGLATHPNWRKKGIMGELMEEAEDAARRRGYDLTFLIPADDHLRCYYARKGYYTASWREREKFISKGTLSENHEEKLNIYSIKDFFRQEYRHFLEEAAECCRERELSRRNDTIVHSKRDFLTAMAENENSIFLTYPSFDPEYPILAKTVGIAFPELPEGKDESLHIVGLYLRPEQSEIDSEASEAFLTGEGKEGLKRTKETAIRNAVLEAIARKFERDEFEIYNPRTESQPDGRRDAYAMVKRLFKNENLDENENLTFEISLMLD
ncbi:MAG: GNAT family N-acetyltransferase [Muribaculaceae bacterium]|nr:GNAT family N-acetyltransferase [Muribaculaceae bacterium]